jgi:hypothetical protein
MLIWIIRSTRIVASLISGMLVAADAKQIFPCAILSASWSPQIS